jgi:hypothetical protein
VDSSYHSGLAPFISVVYDTKAVMTFTIKGLPGGLVHVNHVARGFGCHAVDVETAKDLRRGLSADGPTVIVIPTKPTMDAGLG